MLPLPPFEWIAPTSLDEAVRALAERPGDTRLMAGGTDLLPNLKHGLIAPARLVGLRRVPELSTIEEASDGMLVIGAGVTLARLAVDRRVALRYPALARAAALAASPQLRQMGTLGGNLCLDTRCGYYNQTAFWRAALGHCIKKDGDECHVVPQGRRCVAAFSADTPGPLIAYGAEVELVSARGSRTIPLADFYAGDGIKNNVLEAGELLARVRIPEPLPRTKGAYQKLRARQSIDFPLLSVATVVSFAERGTIEGMRVVVGALGALPRRLRGLDALAAGRALSAEVIDGIATAAHTQCHPLANVGDEGWRRDVIGPMVARSLTSLEPSVHEAR